MAGIFDELLGGLHLGTSLENYFADQAEASWVEKQAQINSQIDTLKASEAEFQGSVEGEQALKRTAALSGQQVGAEAAEGIDVTKGTPAALRLDTARVGGEDFATTMNNAVLKSLGYRIQGQSDIAEAGLKAGALRNEGSQGLLAGGIEFFGSQFKAVGPQNEQSSSDVNPSGLDTYWAGQSGYPQ